jgi:hypothetical protein
MRVFNGYKLSFISVEATITNESLKQDCKSM